jgi:hypothetical protein
MIFKGQYLLSGAIDMMDYQFGRLVEMGGFPSASVGWRIDQEDSCKAVQPFLN